MQRVVDSDAPGQSVDKKCRLGDPHLAVAREREVAKEHADWWRSDMKGKICTQTRKDPAASSALDGRGPASAVRVAEERNRILGRELTEVGERVHVDLVRKAEERCFGVWEQFSVSPPVEVGAQSKDMVDTRWAQA